MSTESNDRIAPAGTMGEEPALDPREALRIIDEQNLEAVRTLRYADWISYVTWGLAYLIGYLPLALSRGPNAIVDIPLEVAIGSFYVCLGVGIAVSVIQPLRLRGVKGANSTRGAYYGASWWLSFLAVGMLIRFLSESGIDGDVLGIAINSIAIAVVGALMMAGGAIFLDRTQFITGVIIAVCLSVALLIGLSYYYWIMSLAVGGSLLVAAVVSRRRMV
ncbi:MAG: hypothetical protein KBB39_04055 [Phycicoccus sp.]|nr:hypothetical protein [Phycicoccus sp.]